MKQLNASLDLPPAFPQALTHIKSNFGFYCNSNDGKFCFHNFHSTYAAKKFLDLIIDGKPFKWINDDKIEIDGRITIRCEMPGQLEKAIEHEYSDEEALWEMPDPMLTITRQFIGKSSVPPTFGGNGNHAEPDHDEPAPRRSRSHRKVDPDVRKVKARMKVKSGDHVTIAQIAQDIGKHPRDCRAALRALKIPKPESGNWAWPKSEAEKIKSKLKGKVR